jgi:N6-adenosine-specific RNA methylase IME4
VSDHFADVSKVIEAGKGAQHEVADIKLTRYACCLNRPKWRSKERRDRICSNLLHCELRNFRKFPNCSKIGGGDRKSNKSSSKLELENQSGILKRLELSKSDAYRCIQLSKPAEKDFLKFLAEVRERDGELSTFSVLRSIVSSQRGSRNEPVFARLPPGKFNLIYADPPWEYSFITNSKWAVENHYPTLSTEQLCEFPISKVAAKDSILFLWATSPKLADAMQLIQSWGFNYRSSMVWVKNGLGMGYYARQNHEFLLIATKGNWPVPPPRARPPSVINANRTRHSAKPEAAYEILEKCTQKPSV